MTRFAFPLLKKKEFFTLAAVILLNLLINAFAYGQIKKPALKIPMGHQQKINSVAFSSDDKLMATGSGDNTFIIWDAKTGYEIRRVNTGAPVQQVIFSPDASYMITVTGQNEVQVGGSKLSFKKWDTNTGKLLSQLPFTGSPNLQFLKPSGNLLVSGYSDGLSKRQQTDFGIPDLTDPAKLDAFLKENERKMDEMTKEMEKMDEKALQEYVKKISEQSKKASEQALELSASFNPDYKKYTLLDPNNFKPVGQMNRGFEKAKIITYNNKNYLLASENAKNPDTIQRETINAWDLQDLLTAPGENNKAIPWKNFPASGKINHIAVSPVKGFFANDDGRAAVRLWQLDKNTALALIKTKGEAVTGIDFSPDGSIIYVYSSTIIVRTVSHADATRYVEGWSTQTLQQVTSAELPQVYSYTPRITLSLSGDYFIVESKLTRLNRWSLVKLNPSGDSTGEFRGRSFSPGYCGFSPGCKQVYINYHGAPDMTEYMRLSTEAGIEYQAYINKKVLTKEEKDKLVKDVMKYYPPVTSREYNGYNLSWDLTHGGAVVQQASEFSFDHQTISTDKNYLLVNERFESGNRENSPTLLKMMQQPIEGISKETADKLKKYRDTSSIYYKVMFAGQLNGPVTLLINQKTKDSISLIKIDSLDWIMLLRNGYYMTSKNGAKGLSYVSGTQVYPFEQFDIKYNRPDLVLKAIGMADPALIEAYRNAYRKRIKKLDLDTTQFKEEFEVPEADFADRNKIAHDQKTAKLSLVISASDNKSKLERFNIWVNEVPLFGKNGKSIKNAKTNKLNTSVEVILSQGMNRIETSVMNANAVESYRVPLLVKYTPDKPVKEITHFIGIGIDQFADNKYNLQYSAKDIRDLSKKLKEKYGDDIVIDTLFNQNVTAANIKALKEKLKHATENDKVIIAYSGHGMLSKDYDYYLSTYRINFERPEQNGLPYDELENLLDSIPARKKLMLIDACHSGEVDKEELSKMQQVQQQLDSTQKGVIVLVDTTNRRLGMKNSFELMQELFVNVGKGTGATVISAAAGTQFALERGDLKNGIFTYSILEAMSKYPTLKISELKKIVGERVEELTKGLQRPTSRNETIAVDWLL